MCIQMVTRRNNNVFITSKRRRRRCFDVMKTLSLRHYRVLCPLGSGVVYNRAISQIPQCMRQTNHNSPLCNGNVHPCAHLGYKMVHYGILNWCIVGFMQQVYWRNASLAMEINKKRAITMRFINKEISSEDWWQYQAWKCLFIPGKGSGLCGIPHPLSYATFNTIGLTNFGAKTHKRCLLSTGCNIHSNVSKSTFYEVSKCVAWSMGGAHKIAFGSAVTEARLDHENHDATPSAFIPYSSYIAWENISKCCIRFINPTNWCMTKIFKLI